MLKKIKRFLFGPSAEEMVEAVMKIDPWFFGPEDVAEVFGGSVFMAKIYLEMAVRDEKFERLKEGGYRLRDIDPYE
jgi:hypothetical protein